MTDSDMPRRLITIPESRDILSRRKLMLGGAGVAVGGILTVGAAAKLTKASDYQGLLDLGDRGGREFQRLVMSALGRPLAPQYRVDQISPIHPSNGGFGARYVDPDPAYDQMLARGFRDWQLRVEGLVQRPGRFSLDDLVRMPRRSQITMHCCDQGWSAIGQWAGVPLGWLLQHVGISESARYVVFYAMDKMQGMGFFDSIDLYDAFHPQTILAHHLNGKLLPKGNGAPLRLRVELQIGYKNLKHIDRIEVVDSLEKVGNGRGGLYQQFGLQWYAGQ